jgi:hypothetical protein
MNERTIAHLFGLAAAMSHRGATANQIDSWIPPHIIQYCYENSPSQMLPRGGRRVVMLAIGKCLKDQYDALASPVPPHLAALVRRLEYAALRVGV